MCRNASHFIYLAHALHFLTVPSDSFKWQIHRSKVDQKFAMSSSCTSPPALWHQTPAEENFVPSEENQKIQLSRVCGEKYCRSRPVQPGGITSHHHFTLHCLHSRRDQGTGLVHCLPSLGFIHDRLHIFLLPARPGLAAGPGFPPADSRSPANDNCNSLSKQSG